MKELYRKYRPGSFDGITGNKETVKSLKTKIKNNTLPHALLFTGNPGTGKTTIGRIIAKEIKAERRDFHEIDSADFRGIDSIRNIRRNMMYPPSEPGGKAVLWLLDECFPKGTPVKTPKGDISIENLKPNSEIYSLKGKDTIVSTLKKQIPLHRLIYLNFGNKEIITTQDHLFLTDQGWIEAHELKNKHLISIAQIRLESSKVYKQGGNEQYFKCIIGDKERDSGFVTMYDLQVKNHSSYFVKDIPVHNCHQIGKGNSSQKNEAQSALLKGLESPPDHCYFVLCTTEPQMLMSTIKSRCTTYQLETLNDQQMGVLLNKTAKQENTKLPKEARLNIIKSAQGKPRRALTILERIIHLNPDEMKVQIQQEQDTEENAIELARILFKGDSWLKAVKVLKGLQNENPEGIRRMIYSYMMTVTSKNANKRAGDIMYFFQNPLYEDGYNKLWFITHQILNEFEL